MPEVYRNLTRGDWSIREGGLVVAHRESVLIHEPRFVVQPAGRARVLRERRKNVHAFVRGEVDPGLPEIGLKWRRISYDPYSAPHFVDVETGAPVESAEWALLAENGKAYYLSREQ
jgi:hypothetical protein